MTKRKTLVALVIVAIVALVIVTSSVVRFTSGTSP
jgi:hypothetical protein